MGQGTSDQTATKSYRNVTRMFAFSRISGIYVWIAIFILFAFWVPHTFLTELTWKNIASSQAITAFVTMGLLFPLIAGAYDLSFGQMLGFSSVFSAYLVTHGWALVPAVLVVVVIAVVVGCFNGFLVAGLGINSFIATLGTSSLLLAGVGLVSDLKEIVGLSSAYKELGQAQPLGIPITVIYLAVAAVIAWYVLEHTPFGRYLHAVGGNAEAARLAGVPTRALVFGSLIVSAVVASLAGILETSTLSAGDPTVGESFLLPVFAAAFLGATQFFPGRFNVPGTLVATYMLATGVAGLQLAGANFWVNSLFDGAVLILALAIGRFQGGVQLGRWRAARRRSASSFTELAAEGTSPDRDVGGDVAGGPSATADQANDAGSAAAKALRDSDAK
jgi:ribose transport system permease protein